MYAPTASIPIIASLLPPPPLSLPPPRGGERGGGGVCLGGLVSVLAEEVAAGVEQADQRQLVGLGRIIAAKRGRDFQLPAARFLRRPHRLRLRLSPPHPRPTE